MSKSISPEEYEKLYGSKLRPKYPRVNPSSESSILELGKLTQKQYELLIDALKGGVDFSMDSDKPLTPEFLEALKNVNEAAIVSDTVIKGMNQYQQLSMFRKTYERRNEIISELKELNIYDNLFEGGIISSKEMQLDEIYESMKNYIITKPESTKPESTKPESTKSASTKPPSTKPASTKPASTKPASTKPPFRHGGQRGGGGQYRVYFLIQITIGNF
jgi:hypothetical protein